MKNGMRTWTAGVGALLLAATLTGCGNGTVQTVAKPTPTAYPAPDVQIVAQPVLVSYNQKAVSRASDEYTNPSDNTYSSHRRHHKHSHHKKAAQEKHGWGRLGHGIHGGRRSKTSAG